MLKPSFSMTAIDTDELSCSNILGSRFPDCNSSDIISGASSSKDGNDDDDDVGNELTKGSSTASCNNRSMSMAVLATLIESIIFCSETVNDRSSSCSENNKRFHGLPPRDGKVLGTKAHVNHVTQKKEYNTRVVLRLWNFMGQFFV